MKNMNSFLQSIILFTFLSIIGGALHYVLYLEEYKNIQSQTDYLYHVEKDRLHKYLRCYSDVLNAYKLEFEEQGRFDKSVFEKLAHKFLIHFKDTKAFNFVDSDYIIQNVNPIIGNEAALGKSLLDHPDNLIRDIFQTGLSRKEINFIPPVEIYQGGKAIIFYIPINFKEGSFGWINVVILSEKLFNSYQQAMGILNFSFSVYDRGSNRYFFNEKDNHSLKESETITFNSSLLGRDIVYLFNLEGQYRFIRGQSIKEYLFFLLIAFILSFIFFLYSKGRQALYGQFVNVTNESNLLKTLIHDISTPAQFVLLGLQHLNYDKKFDQILIDSLLRHQTLTSEVVHTVRNVFSGKLLLANAVNVDLAGVVNGFIEDYQQAISDAQLSIDIQIKETAQIITRLDPLALKNHVLRNLISNAIKFSTPKSTLTIVISPQQLEILNHHQLLSSSKLKELNDLKPMESLEDSRKNTSLGFGMFIAKLFCRHANINYFISQDQNTQIVSTKITFPTV